MATPPSLRSSRSSIEGTNCSISGSNLFSSFSSKIFGTSLHRFNFWKINGPQLNWCNYMNCSDNICVFVSSPPPSASVATKTLSSLCFFIKLCIFLTAPLRLGTSFRLPQIKSFLRRWTPRYGPPLAEPSLAWGDIFFPQTAQEHPDEDCLLLASRPKRLRQWFCEWCHNEQWTSNVVSWRLTHFHSCPVLTVNSNVAYIRRVQVFCPEVVAYDPQVLGKDHTAARLSPKQITLEMRHLKNRDVSTITSYIPVILPSVVIVEEGLRTVEHYRPVTQMMHTWTTRCVWHHIFWDTSIL